jgi:hypothetical protein
MFPSNDTGLKVAFTGVVLIVVFAIFLAGYFTGALIGKVNVVRDDGTVCARIR